MANNIKILFWLFKSKPNKQGELPLMLRISYQGERKQIYTGFYLAAKKWDNNKGVVKGKDENANQLNNYIRNSTNKILEIFNEMAKVGDVFLDNIYDRFLGKDGNHMTLMQLVDYHNQQMKERIGTDYAIATLKKYEVTKGKLVRFLSHKGKRDVRLKDLTRDFIADFDLYMKSQEKNDQNTTTKHCKNLKTMINMAVFKGWLEKTPFDKYKTPYKVKEKVFLTQQELAVIEKKEFKIKRLSLVKDLFVFQCYTGLAFSDMAELKGRDITMGIDGNKWIIKYRRKTDIRSAIPLLKQALSIIEKYNPDFFLILGYPPYPMCILLKGYKIPCFCCFSALKETIQPILFIEILKV